MPGSFCTVCRRRIARGSRCAKHRIVSPSSRSWHQRGAAAVRQQVLKRDGHSCTICGSTVNLEAHHRLAARDGGRTTLENLVTLCSGCHLEAEREKRASPRDPSS